MSTEQPQPTSALGSSLSALPATTAVSGVAKRLLESFTDGTVAPGERLPSERELAAALGIGRSAVREALAALEILGIVSVRPGSGTYLRGSASELLSETLDWGLMLSSERTAELIDLRAELECTVARRAAEQADDALVAALTERLEAMEAALDQPRRAIDADLGFHRLLDDAAGNPVLADLLRSVRSLLRVWTDRGMDAAADARHALDEHRAVLEAVTARDAAAAERAMRQHMSTASTRLLSAARRA